MKQIRSEIEIDAPAERVWTMLTDFQAFSEWNPFVRRASGEVETGARLDVYIKPPGGMGMSFHPTVLKAETDKELRWLGHFILPGLFDGEHFFRIEPSEDSRVQFVQGELCHSSGFIKLLCVASRK